MKYTFADVKNVFYLNRSRNYSFLEYYKNYMMYVMDRQIELDKDEATKWMANIKSPSTFYLTTALNGMYLTAQTQFDLTKKVVDEKAEELAQKLISINQKYFDTNDTQEEMNRVALDSILLGTGFGQIIYRRVSDEINDMADGGTKNESRTYKIPSVEYISPLNIYIDPAARSVYNSRFMIIRKVKNKKSLQNYYSEYLNGDKIDLAKVESGEILEQKDRDMVVRYMMFNNMPGVEFAGMTPNQSGTNVGQHYDILTDNSYKFGETDSTTKTITGDLVEVYELHTDNEITLFFNGVQYGSYKKTFPRNKKPFFSIKLKAGLNFINGIGVGHLAYNLQKMSDMFLNLRMDMSRLESTAPIAVDAGDSYFDGQETFKPYPGKIVKLTDPTKGWKKLEYGYNPAVAGQEVELITKSIQDSLGLSGYALGVQQKVERVAAGVKELVDSVDRSFAEFVTSYAQAMSFIQKYWTIMTVKTVNPKYLEKLIGENVEDIKKIDVAEIVYEYNFGFNLNPMKKMKDAAEIQQLLNFMQTAGNMTRPDGTPLVDNEFVVDQMIEKMNLPSGTKLTKEEALEYMKDQINRNAELKKLEQGQLQSTPEQIESGETGGIVPEFNTKPETSVIGATGGTAGIQGGSIAGETRVTNPEGINATE